MKARTAPANLIGGILTEYRIVIPQENSHITQRLPEVLEYGDQESACKFHQGQRLASIKSPDVWLQSLPSYRHQWSAWQTGGACTVSLLAWLKQRLV